MAATVINGATGAVADITIATVSQAVQFNDVTVSADVEQFESATFADEPSDEVEPGVTRLTADLSGVLKKGVAASGPLIPPPQKVAMMVQFDVGCTISSTWNFVRATARRIANNMATLTGSARSTGPIVKAWVITGS